jgi:hypothetical protein
MRLLITSAVLAFLLWCVTDTSLKADHVRNSKGKISIHGILLVVLVQIVLWIITGVSAVWIVPHLPRYLLTGWRSPLTLFGSCVVQWFALLMVLQYVWIIVRATLSTAFVGAMAAFYGPPTISPFLPWLRLVRVT